MSHTTSDASRSDTTALPKRMSAEEFLAYPWPHGTRAELHHGEVIMAPSPSGRHQRSERNLLLQMVAADPEMKLGELLPAPMDVRLPNGHVVQPDVLLRHWDTPMPDDRYVDGAPLLVVEVLSTRPRLDEVGKFELYQDARVPEYWIVDPENIELVVYVLDKESGRYHSQEPDAQGFALSPTYGKHVRFIADESRYGSRLEWRE